MAMKPATLIIPVFGAREYVRRCLDSLPRADLSVVEQIIIYDNAFSQEDGTRELLRTYARESADLVPEGVVLIESDRNLRHGESLDECVPRVRTPYFIAIHSDVIFFGCCFPPLIRELQLDNRAIACACVQQYGYGWRVEKERNAFFAQLPNCRSTLGAFRTAFIRKHGIRFKRLRCRVYEEDYAEAPSWVREMIESEGEGRKFRIVLDADTGWEICCAATLLGYRILPLPEAVRDHFVHICGRSRALYLKQRTQDGCSA